MIQYLWEIPSKPDTSRHNAWLIIHHTADTKHKLYFCHVPMNFLPSLFCFSKIISDSCRSRQNTSSNLQRWIVFGQIYDWCPTFCLFARQIWTWCTAMNDNSLFLTTHLGVNGNCDCAKVYSPKSCMCHSNSCIQILVYNQSISLYYKTSLLCIQHKHTDKICPS